MRRWWKRNSLNNEEGKKEKTKRNENEDGKMREAGALKTKRGMKEKKRKEKRGRKLHRRLLKRNLVTFKFKRNEGRGCVCESWMS